MKICYIHGAGATERSFVWLERNLPKHESIFFNYTVDDSLLKSITNLNKLTETTQPDIVIGHSLGGIMAFGCVTESVKKIVSLCAPFGGVRYAEFMYMFSLEQMYYDLRSNGPILKAIRNKPISKENLVIVGTSGLPFTNEPNDGVVTVASQMALPDANYMSIDLNHFEVLMSKEISEIITDFIKFA
jgi:pimeloyl-ACP methyl ester carboxylesterase